MLAGDADRDRTVNVLKDAFADGRLTQSEYEERVGRAYQARTYQELDLLTGDVPRPAPFGFAPAVPPRTDPYAIASLACGIAGTFLVVPALPAVVLGHMARSRIRRTGDQGDGLAVGGLVLGYVVSAAVVAFVALIVLLVLFAG
jgi:hypothetical protein